MSESSKRSLKAFEGKVLNWTIHDWETVFPLIPSIRNYQEVFWFNENTVEVETALNEVGISLEQIQDTERRLKRFAPFFMKAFPETKPTEGILESPLRVVSEYQEAQTAGPYEIPFGRLILKLDSHLPISGSIKARGGIYEVLQHAERLAMEAGMLQEDDNYEVFSSQKMQKFFSDYRIAVGSTGNLGLSIGIISAKLGFKAQVHMSSDAKSWKKALLREKGVEVIEYDSDYSVAVEQGRKEAEKDPKTYFVDDENSIHLFLGYAVAALRLKGQLEHIGFVPSEESPLFVYLPCGVGGGPGGVAYGLKRVFGQHVHCYFAEPTHSPCMLIGMMTDQHDALSVQDFGLDNITIADGLAVGRPSSFVGKALRHLLNGIFTVTDAHMLMDLAQMADLEALNLEPSALAGLSGPSWLKKNKAAYAEIQKNYTPEALNQAIHLSWATGGSMVPESVMHADIESGRKLLKVLNSEVSDQTQISKDNVPIVMDDGSWRSTSEIEADSNTVAQALWLFNRLSGPESLQTPSKPVRLFLRKLDGEILGGLLGKLYRNALFIDVLYVDASLRGFGWGEKLVSKAEQIARSENATFAHLDTFSFQAPEFYEKLGYICFGVLDDFEDGSKRYFYKKVF